MAVSGLFTHMKPTLLILAAGMGSRYGGLKQLDRLGPSGETILEYSVYDAIRAGFGKVVFVIREHFRQQFEEQVCSKFKGRIEIALVTQELDMLPEPFKLPEGRTKPWGTGHAILCAKAAVKEPFAVINADDFYGRGSFEVLAKFLGNLKSSTPAQFALVGYKIRNTLSENGSVSRGICSTGANGKLTGLTERTNITDTPECPIHTESDGTVVKLPSDCYVSMNCWGFDPVLFKCLEEQFHAFLEKSGKMEKSEFYIPFAVDECIKRGQAEVTVLPTSESWFGVTYTSDKERSQEQIRAKVAAGIYPSNLWA